MGWGPTPAPGVPDASNARRERIELVYVLRDEREKGSLMPFGAGGENGGGRSWLEKERPNGVPWATVFGIVVMPTPPCHGDAIGVVEPPPPGPAVAII